MENFGHSVVSVGDDEAQIQVGNSILYVTNGVVNIDGKLKQLAVLSDSGVGQLVTISSSPVKVEYQEDEAAPNTPTTSPIKVEYQEEEETEYVEQEVEYQEQEDEYQEQGAEYQEQEAKYQEQSKEPPKMRRRMATTTPKAPPVCKICCKTFSKQKGYTKHMRKIHKVFVRPKEPATAIKAPVKDTVCPYCNKTFTQKGSMNVHILAIHNPQGLEHTYKCAECDYKTFIKSKFHAHMVRNHLTKKPEKKKIEIREYPCELCDKVFKIKSILNAHLNKVHFPQHNYNCDLCDYTTTDKYFYKKHLVRRHLSKKPKGNFKCDKCDATFQKLIYLKVHKKRVHRILMPNNMHRKKCPLCPFVSKQLYRDEILAHFKDIHEIEINPEKLVFDNVESFNMWRKNIQERTKSQYRGDILTESRTKWFNCHRSGHYDLSKSHRTIITTIKLNAFCPAAIHTTRRDNDMLEVEYWPVHVGHDPNEPNIKKTFLTNSDVEVHRIKKTFERRKSTRKASRRKPVQDSDDDNDIEVTQPVHRSSKQDYDKLVQSTVQTKRKLQKIEDGVEVITVDNIDDESIEVTPEDKTLMLDYDKLVKDSLDMELAESSVDDGTVLHGEENATHLQPTSYKCGYCSFFSTVREDCQKHVREEHANHKCNECDFRTTDYTKLRVHMRIHSAQLRLFQCELCDKMFPYKRELKLHLEATHNEKGRINYYKCDHCDYTSSNNRRLESHILNYHDAVKIEISDGKYKCKLCDASYHTQSNLHSHEKLEHNLEQASDCGWLGCSDCAARFRHRSSLFRHEKRAHNSITVQLLKRCPLCEFASPNRTRGEMHHHLKETHNITLTSEVFAFNNLTSFTEWKADLEAVTGSTLNGRQGSKTKYYMCLKSTRTLADGGDKQQAAFCPSEIHLRQFGDGQLLAEYWPLHVGHKTENNLDGTLSSSWVNSYTVTQRDINTKYFLKQYSNTKCFLSNNENLSDKQDCPKNPNTEEFFDSVWIDILRENLKTCILHVKPSNEVSNAYPSLQFDDFFLICMTHAQSNKFTKLFSMNGTIIIDKTCNLGVNLDLHLFTILVVDESKAACPVACMFTNNCDADEDLLSIFFEKLKLTFGGLTPEVFMSTFGDLAYSVWCKIMFAAKTNVYSTLHVLRAWKSNLDKISNNENREHVSSVLKSLLCEVDKTVFIELLDEIKKSLMFENEEFFKYFSDNFLTNLRYKLWANCFVGERDVSFESYERVLKQCHLIGMGSTSLNKVLRLDVETFANESRDWSSESVTEKLSIIEDRHTSWLGVTTRKCVTKVENCTWMVKSLRTRKEFSVVKKICSCCSCELVCNKCQSCAHEYVCSCWDSAVRDNMCVHVHLVARSLLHGNEGCETDMVDEPEEEDGEENVELDLVVDESEEEEKEEEEEEDVENEDDQEGEEIVIHCGDFVGSKSVNESVDLVIDESKEIDDPDWVFDISNDNEEILDINQINQTRNKTRNESKQLKSVSTSDDNEEVLDENQLKQRNNCKVSRSIDSDVICMDINKKESTMPKIKLNTRRKRADLSSEDDIEVMDLDEGLKTSADRSKKRKVISCDDNVKNEELNNLLNDLMFESDEELSPISKSEKIVGKSDKEGCDSVQESNLLGKNEPQLQLNIVDVRSMGWENAEDKKKDVPDKSQRKPKINVIPMAKLQAPLKVANPKSVGVKSTGGSVSRNEYDKIVGDVIYDKSKKNARINVISPSKLQSTPEVINDSKRIKNKQGTSKPTTKDEKEVNEIIPDKSQKTPRINMVTRSKFKTPLKVVDSKSMKNTRGSVSKSKDEKQDKKVISDKSQKNPSVSVTTKSKLQTALENGDSKSVESKRKRVGLHRNECDEMVEKVVSDKSQRKPGTSVTTRSKLQTPLKVSDSKSIKSTRGKVSKTKNKKEDDKVICGEVSNEAEPEEAPEFEDSVMKFVEFCQKKATSKEQMEYIKKMMSKVIPAADSDS